MRNVPLSTEVYAEIWKRHKPGDSSEDDILRREFGLPAAPASTVAPSASTAPTATSSVPVPPSPRPLGFEDKRNGVKLEENFEIFKNYKGTLYTARATGGEWLLLNDNTRHPSLHKLSWHVVKGPENAWYGWKYRDKAGANHYVNGLRS